jgi:hypothetical protein
MRERYRYQLTKYEKNDLFRAIDGSGVPVIDFELSEERVKPFIRSSISLARFLSIGTRVPRTVTIIRHARTSSAFGVVKTQYDWFKVQYETGGRKPESVVLGNWTLSANEDVAVVLDSVDKWVNEIKGFLDDAGMPNLWDNLKHGRDFAARPRRTSRTFRSPLVSKLIFPPNCSA